MYEISLDLLAMFDGTMDSKIFIAIKGVVFDVTPAKEKYEAGGEYHAFAGKEITRGLAKHSLLEEDLIPYGSLEDLSPEELKQIDGWVDYYSGKYKIVGKIV